jgi:hypothetical protein
MEAEQAKAQIDIAKKRAEIQAKLEADITLLTVKAGLDSQDESGGMPSGLDSTSGMMGDMESQLRPPMQPMEEEQPEEEMFNPENARQAIMQRQQSNQMPMEEEQPEEAIFNPEDARQAIMQRQEGGQMPMGDTIPMQDVGTMQEEEGIL